MAHRVSLNAGNWIGFANNTSLAAATKVWASFRTTGATLKAAAADGGVVVLDAIGNSDLSAQKTGLVWWGSIGKPAIMDNAGGLIGLSAGSTGDTNIADLDDATEYEIGWVVNDNAALGGSTQHIMLIYPAGGVWGGTTIAAWWSFGAYAPPTTAGLGCRFVGGSPAVGGSHNVAGIYDWAKIGDDNTTAFEDAELEEGSGNAVSPSGTITGTEGVDFTWLGGAGDPDHGIVTLTSSTIALGGTTTASVVWYDAANNPLSPQPATTWNVVNDSHAATVDASTGVVTGAAAGSATIRAVTGIVTATADVTVTNPYSFSGTITVS